ncbi:hypothetical protein GCM10007304_02010 [Rhodococcoides trifolii]|uniref:DUF2786 domain-containing protein n=1 Tax=Rhodococcoides trifolii TaxID=908250 RepID=A0A917CLZ9_9NOCA|nr:DUF2786 domain-containing protein [Rhodococcus trifolii]GGF91669.1 hypothetical protein GCM10007304_02010 [Rhodococcus trifolii]
MSSDKMLARIGGLLRQAESTDNPHEAEAFMEAAQRLATSSAIDLAVARSHTASREKRATPVQRMVRIGEPGKKGLRTYVQLFLAIARANDVQCDIAQSSAQVFAYGFDSDIDTCEALYASLIVQMVKASDAYIKSGEYRTATVQRVVVQTRGRRRYRVREEKPLAGVTARLEFQLAFAVRIGERLGEAKKKAETEAIEAAPEVGTALVLRNKEIELKDFYSSTSTARGTWRGQSATAGFSHGARRAGDRAGRAARLGGEPELGRGSTQLER